MNPPTTDTEPIAETATESEKATENTIAPTAAAVEALLFTHGEPLARARITEILGIGESELEQACSMLRGRMEGDDSGIELIEVADKLQLRSKQLFASYLRALRAEAPRRLSTAALETLAVIAYRQPVVRSDIEKIRGVDVTPTLKTLLDRGIVTIVGHQASVGQPALYGTTEEFLALFGLRSLGDLPSLRDLREIEVDPGEPQSGNSAMSVDALETAVSN